jgi:FlaA1/EpsC-like NDP-sugar epimerase
VFVLDMGEPVSIDAFARRFVAAHGLVPLGPEDVATDAERRGEAGAGGAPAGTIRIAHTGIRPGEKLHEDLGHHRESMRPTRHPGINAWVEPLPDPELVERILAVLHRGRRVRDPRLLAAELRRLAAEADASLEAAGPAAGGPATRPRRATAIAELTGRPSRPAAGTAADADADDRVA